MIRQCTLKLQNQPGALQKMVALLAHAGVNLRALEVSERGGGGYGICHFIASDVEKAEQVLTEAGYESSVADVVVVAMEDEVGGLATVLEALTSLAVNIKYLYAFVTQVKGKSMAVFGVAEPRKVADALEEKGLNVIRRSSAVESAASAPDRRVDVLDYYLGGTYFW